MSDYQIRLHKLDGALSIIMMVSAIGDTDAKNQALLMLKNGLSNAYIWREKKLVASIDAPLDLAKSA